MEGTYFFGEHLRWNLGWENPNPAGAFIATFIPLLWGISYFVGSKKIGRLFLVGLLLLAELSLWFLLCKTYSRGALVAIGASSLIFFLWFEFQEWKTKEPLALQRRPRWSVLTARVLGVLGLLIFTGFIGRIEPSYITNDASTGNRLTLWKGGLQMIAVEPWRGWGIDQSGTAFMHWFQPLDETAEYAGMVNSYLHIGVERGLPLLILCSTILGGIVILPFRQSNLPSPSANAMRFGAAFALFTFLVANIFSTLWIFKNLWWGPLFFALVVIISVIWSHKKKALKMVLSSYAIALSLSFVLASFMWMAGSYLNDGLRISLLPNGNVLVENQTSQEQQSATKHILFLPDRHTLGEHYGKEVRRLAMEKSFGSMTIQVPKEKQPLTSQQAKFTHVIACGQTHQEAFEFVSRHPDLSLILVHPLGKPGTSTTALPGKTMIQLPSLDTHNSGRTWRKFVRTHPSCTIHKSLGVGQDIRLLWPQSLSMFLNSK